MYAFFPRIPKKSEHGRKNKTRLFFTYKSKDCPDTLRAGLNCAENGSVLFLG
jgi:hypothetical protein